MYSTKSRIHGSMYSTKSRIHRSIHVFLTWWNTCIDPCIPRSPEYMDLYIHFFIRFHEVELNLFRTGGTVRLPCFRFVILVNLLKKELHFRATYAVRLLRPS
jgi:hypothetical protein